MNPTAQLIAIFNHLSEQPISGFGKRQIEDENNELGALFCCLVDLCFVLRDQADKIQMVIDNREDEIEDDGEIIDYDAYYIRPYRGAEPYYPFREQIVFRLENTLLDAENPTLLLDFLRSGEAIGPLDSLGIGKRLGDEHLKTLRDVRSLLVKYDQMCRLDEERNPDEEEDQEAQYSPGR